MERLLKLEHIMGLKVRELQNLLQVEVSMTVTTAKRLYSFEEYLAFDDGTDNRYELVDGRLELMNPPTFRHLLIAKFVEQIFDAEIRRLGLPWLCFKEAGIRTGWRKSRLSDLYIVPVEQVRDFLDRSAVTEIPPLLAVEVVSPESVSRDYRYKRSEYAALEIPEYWIVDPMESKVTVLLWEEGLYEETVFTGNQNIVSRTFPELTLTVEQVLAAGNVGQKIGIKKKLMRYAVVIEKGETSYGAYVPDLPGCVAVAESLAEVRSLIKEAIAFHLEGLQEDGCSIPEPASICEYVDA